jgi:hypothetical protein
MEKVTGIGGIFFKADEAKSLGAWYRDHLGIAVDETYGGATFEWRERAEPGIGDQDLHRSDTRLPKESRHTEVPILR